MMTSDKKLAFLHKMAKLGLDSIPHYDDGGVVTAFNAPGTALPGPSSGVTSGGAPNPNAGFAGTISGALGINNNYQAGGANIQQGTNTAQLNQAYTGAQQGIANQAGLVQAVQPGVTQGVNTQSTLAQQLANEANGVGPNPAQAALNQSTGQNINEAAALAASQRGAGTNAGLIAEGAARQGASTQQQAIGQAATLQAQQQIAAQQQEQQLAAQQVAQGAGAIQGQNQVNQGEQAILEGANTSANNAAVSQQGNINDVNARTAAGNQNVLGNVIGGVLSGGASAVGAISSLFAEGGEVHKMASGGYMAPTPLIVAGAPSGPQSFIGQWANAGGVAPGGGAMPAMQTVQPYSGGQAGFSEQAGSFGKALGSIRGGPIQTGEYAGGYGEGPSGMGSSDFGGSGQDAYGNNSGAEMMAAKGGKVKKMLPPMHGKNSALIARGGKVKAESKDEKAVKNADSYANDKVPALLSEGEVVMDKDTLNDPGPIGQMARAVAHHIQTRNTANKGTKRVQKS